jgi:RsmE family RNA methyltransferase
MKKHIFSVYTKIENISKNFLIEDKLFYKRVKNVLRLKPNEEIKIFNENNLIHSKILKINNNSVHLELLELSEIKEMKPKINLYNGLLKKDSMEELSFICGKFGVNQLTPLITKKISRSFNHKNEFERLFKKNVSGCEISNNYFLTKINKPLSLEELINKEELNLNSINIYCKRDGELNVNKFLNILNLKNNLTSINIIIGPEGDLTKYEEEFIKNSNKFLELTLSNELNLTSLDASQLIIGLIRSLN